MNIESEVTDLKDRIKELEDEIRFLKNVFVSNYKLRVKIEEQNDEIRLALITMNDENSRTYTIIEQFRKNFSITAVTDRELEEIIFLIKNNLKIESIKKIREVMPGTGLRDAKIMMEKMQDHINGK